LKTFKTVIIEELWKLLNQKILVNFIFFGIVFLDALGAILPKYLDRKVTMFAAFPLILCIYLLNASKKNILFIISLFFNFLGIYNFNNPYERYNSAGLIYHTIAFFIYCIILFRDIQIINWKTVLKLAIPIVLFVLISVSIYSDGMRTMLVFKETILYVSSATIFMLGTFLLSLNKKTTVNYTLILSGISILLSSVFQGYNLFLEKNKFLGFFAIIFFNLTHYLVCLYLIKKSNVLSFNQKEV
jgi:hypothetical protein